MRTGQGVAAAVGVLAATLASSVASAAETSNVDATQGTTTGAVRRELSPYVAAGLAVAAVDYGQYGLGATVRAGVDRRTGGRLDLRLGVVGSFTRFDVPGATLDLGTVEATGRVTPMRFPLYVTLSTGLLASRESFDVTLARGRRIDDVTVRGGIPVAAGVGVTLLRHVDVEAGYRHAFFVVSGGPATFGQAAFTLGGRF